MKNSALGLIETYGYVGAVEAADAALKAADVSLVDLVKVKGGIVTLTLEGGVSEVRASVDAGSASAERLGTLLTSHVIPRLDEEVWSIVDPKVEDNDPDPPEDPSKNEDDDQHEEEDHEEEKGHSENQEEGQRIDQDQEEELSDGTKENPPVDSEPFTPLEDKSTVKPESAVPKAEYFTKEMLEKIKVVELRTIARSLEDINIEKNQIKFANKATLIKEISEAQERRSERT